MVHAVIGHTAQMRDRIVGKAVAVAITKQIEIGKTMLGRGHSASIQRTFDHAAIGEAQGTLLRRHQGATGIRPFGGAALALAVRAA